MPVKKLLFVDTNIWLDFYRARTEAGLSLLDHLEQISDKIIVTHQLEMEFKKNRHSAMMEGIGELKPAQGIARPGLFSNAKEVQAINSGQKKAETRIKKLKERYVKALNTPAVHDPVYKVCQRIFHKDDALVLTREMSIRKAIRNRALRRFLHGCPPRKKGDTSMGDALNWEWMIECANSQNAELVIVSRDGDYGTVFENKGYPNDHLVQEFHERVSRRRKLLLYNKLSEALQHFKIKVSESEKREEEEIAQEAIAQTAEPVLDPVLVDAQQRWKTSLARFEELRRHMTILQSPENRDRVRRAVEALKASQIIKPDPPGQT